MSTLLIDLGNRIVTDRGEVVASYELLLKRARQGLPLDMMAQEHPEVHLYGAKSGRHLKIWEDDGDLSGPDPETFVWDIPEEYQQLDIQEFARAMLLEKGLTLGKYQTRLDEELQVMKEREMFPFLRCLIWVTDVFRENDVVWGIGRGSSCASLVLFLLGVNKVDPIRYEIPMEEFLK